MFSLSYFVYFSHLHGNFQAADFRALGRRPLKTALRFCLRFRVVDCWFLVGDYQGMESPLVAILTSNGADQRVTSRGFPSLAHLLSPFSTHTLDIRDPNGQVTSVKLTVDFRDIRKQGHLLSLSVLPHVLQEALNSSSNLDEALTNYSECLYRFAEPIEQETLRTFIACIFVVASSEENPMGELSRLIQLQHTQQHATTEKEAIGPAHCSSPKWTTPNTLKYYVLLHDSARDDELKSTQCFNQMCTTYGMDSCQMLKIGEGITEESPSIWQKLDYFDRLLENGLVRALQHAQEDHQNEKKEYSQSSVSTIAPSYTMCQPRTLSPFGNKNALATDRSASKLTSEVDRQACGKMVESFLRNSLVPHVERLMRNLNEQLADRRTIGKSLTSGMKKWFGGGSAQNSIATPTSYTAESGEMKSRRLADLAYQFGLYAFAHSQYRAVKKDFENDQAWIYHATALEMSAVALRFSAPELNAKQFPIRYLEDSIKHLLNGAAKYSSIMRCAINASRILAELEQPKEAANLISQVSSLDNDHCVGVAQVHAAKYYQDAGMERKSAFYYVLAGNRFMKGGIPAVALECYRLALGHYFVKQWDSIEDHLCYIISSQSLDKRLAIDCASRLLRSSPWQTENDQNRFVDNFTQTLERFNEGTASVPVELPVPTLCSQETIVICGERPLSSDVTSETDNIEWSTIRRGAFYAVAGNSASFHESSLRLVSNDKTNNRDLRETPPGEHFRVIVPLTNPLSIMLHLRKIHLVVGEVNYVEGADLSSPPFTYNVMEKINLSPGETQEIELSILPDLSVKNFRITAISLNIVDHRDHEIYGRLPFNIKGKRLNRNAKEMKKCVYAEDNRLAAKVSHQKWPLLDFRVQKSPSNVFYCSQAVKLKVEVSNIGFEAIESLILATDGIDCVEVIENKDEKQHNCPSSMAVSSNNVRIHSLAKNVSVGSSTSFIVSIRAPQIESEKSIALLFFYRGVSGTHREWRLVFDMQSVSLIQATANILDPLSGMVQLNVINTIEKLTDAEIAEIDILKVQAVCHKSTTSGDYSIVPSGVRLGAVTVNPIHLDNGQSAGICFTMARDKLCAEDEGRFWLHEKIKYPSWSLPWPVGENPPVLERMISILWRSNIVDQGGFKSVIMGELFVPCPFKAASLSIPGTELNDDGEIDENYCPLSVRCPSLDVFRHDFKSYRLCEFPLSFHIYNQDFAKRAISVTVSFIPKVTEAVEAVSQVAPESRQLWWPDRLVTRATINHGQEHLFKFGIRVTQPSVYDVGGTCFRIDGRFSDSDETITLQAPSTLIVVNSV